MLSYKKLINLITDYRTTRTKSNEKIIDLTRITFFAFDIITRSSTQNFIFECNNSHTILRNAGTHTTSVPEDYSCRITVLKERSKMCTECTTSWFANGSLWPQTCKTVGKYPCTGYSDQKSCGTQDYKRIEILFHTIFLFKWFALNHSSRVESTQKQSITTFLSTRLRLRLERKAITEFIHGNTNRWFIIWIITKRDTTRPTLIEKTIKIITKYSSTLLSRWLSRWKISRCKRIITRKRRKGKRSSTNRESYYERKNIFPKFLFHRKNLLSPITPHIV